MSQIRQNFHKDCEDAINNQINMELFASYTYMSLALYMDRDDVALPRLYNYFSKASEEEREHALKFMKYQNKRGGQITLKDVNAPNKINWGSAEDSMQAALELEKEVNDSLLKLHTLATDKGDAHLTDFLESDFLAEQVESIKELSEHITNLKRVGEGLGVYIFDKNFDKE
ncbi:ferritin 3 heavy chain homolog [Arctopsyche grandis]|uniref:ferritin 3 heavy chain homolog n=1 Tax=Arctopsyche grandis TaxID=121162 RepID=UPI00406D8B9F